MENCIFCKIVRGELPAFKVYDDGIFFGFLDIRPLNPGNVLLIPKKHYRWVYDVPEFGRYFETAKQIGLAAQRTVGADSINFLTVGEEVPHAHIRIIPRFKNDGGVMELVNIKTIEKPKMQEIAKLIIEKLDPS
jgi:histidine triad (HIT) family protein